MEVCRSTDNRLAARADGYILRCDQIAGHDGVHTSHIGRGMYFWPYEGDPSMVPTMSTEGQQPAAALVAIEAAMATIETERMNSEWDGKTVGVIVVNDGFEFAAAVATVLNALPQLLALAREAAGLKARMIERVEHAINDVENGHYQTALRVLDDALTTLQKHGAP